MKNVLSNVVFNSVRLTSVLLLAACASTAATPTPLPAKTPTSIQLNWTYDFGFAGFYAADKNGRFAAQNLDVKLVEGGFKDSKFIDPIQSVLDGHADFGMASAIDLLAARATGKPLVAVATTLQRSPLVLISLAKSNIRKPQDLARHKVALNSGGATIAYNTLLSSQNIDPSTINTLDRTSSGVDDLVKGRVDVLMGWVDSEGVQVKEAGFEPTYIALSDYGVDTYEDLIFTTDKMVKDHSDTVQRFVKAVQQGLQDVVNDSSQAADYTLQYASGGDKSLSKANQVERINASIPLLNPAGSHAGLMTDDVWKQTNQILQTQKILTQPVDYKSAYTLAFVQDAATK